MPLQAHRTPSRGHALMRALADSTPGSDAALAASIGVSKSTLSRILNPARWQAPTLATALLIDRATSGTVPVAAWGEPWTGGAE